MIVVSSVFFIKSHYLIFIFLFFFVFLFFHYNYNYNSILHPLSSNDVPTQSQKLPEMSNFKREHHFRTSI